MARVWLYMRDVHGVRIDDGEHDMFQRWSEMDPVTQWEKVRDRRITDIQGNSNPYVADAVACDGDSCCSRQE